MKESNYNQIVMSQEFETIDQPLMVEIIRRRQMPQVRMLAEPHIDNICGNNINITFVLNNVSFKVFRKGMYSLSPYSGNSLYS